eukprot:1071111_1
MQTTAAYIYYIPCAITAFITVIVLYRWYKTQKFIFAVYDQSYMYINMPEPGVHNGLHGMANWSLLFTLAILGMTIAFVANFVYPLLVLYGVIPDYHPAFVVRMIDSLLYLPLITPLIRCLDKVLEYSKYRVLQYHVIESAR